MLAKAHKSRPSQANLRRAASTTYYALFHCLARSCADLLLGGAGASKGKKAWSQTYRALNHKPAKDACLKAAKNKDLKFPSEIKDFANAFVTMQEKRHDADYDPEDKLTKSEVLQDIFISKQAIKDFMKAPTKDRRAFCVWILFKDRS